MKILIVGNLGYIGPVVVQQLRKMNAEATLVGFDIGYFAHCITTTTALPDLSLDAQIFGDVRQTPPALFDGVDAIVYLAAISNDPMGNAYEKATLDINFRSAISIALRAKKQGVRVFVFASSCSVYGFAEEGSRDENSPLDPLTAYARSKVFAERDLHPLASSDFKITCLRFATACGMSPRLRLDLVVNDFVASAVSSGKISILSNGQPWRPLIHVSDMAGAIAWAIQRDAESGGDFLIVNTGSEAWNYQVRTLAEAVSSQIPGVEISINQFAPPDRRSYRVDFGLFRKLAPAHQPKYDLVRTIQELRDGLRALGFRDRNFRQSQFVRLNTLSALREKGQLSEELTWRQAT